MRYLIPFAFTLAACFGMQALALRAAGGRTAKSESNFFSSLGRIQAGSQGGPKIMVLGSSITGRLPDRAQGYAGVANMGCDGGHAVDALRAMDKGIIPSAPWIIIEANTLFYAIYERPTEIGQAMLKPWFRLGMKVPCISAFARPAAFIYSKLLLRRTGDSGHVVNTADLGVASRPRLVTNISDSEITPGQHELIDKIRVILGRLEAKGCRAMIVWLPPARGAGSPPPEWILALASQCGVPYWDLGQEAAQGTVYLTDATHMDGPSAARTMVSLLKAIEH